MTDLVLFRPPFPKIAALTLPPPVNRRSLSLLTVPKPPKRMRPSLALDQLDTRQNIWCETCRVTSV